MYLVYIYIYIHCSYEHLQETIAGVYRSIYKLVKSPDFESHISKKGNIHHGVEKLPEKMDDIMKTDCPIVVVGK